MPYCCKKSGKSLKKGGKRNRVGNFVCSEMCETRVLMISCAVKCAAKVLIFVYDCSHLTHRQQQNLPTGSSLMKRPKKRGNKLKITGDSENKYFDSTNPLHIVLEEACPTLVPSSTHVPKKWFQSTSNPLSVLPSVLPCFLLRCFADWERHRAV